MASSSDDEKKEVHNQWIHTKQDQPTALPTMRKGGNAPVNREAMRQTRRRNNMTTASILDDDKKNLLGRRERPNTRTYLRAACSSLTWSTATGPDGPMRQMQRSVNSIMQSPHFKYFKGGTSKRAPRHKISLPVRSHHGKQLPRPKGKDKIAVGAGDSTVLRPRNTNGYHFPCWSSNDTAKQMASIRGERTP